MSNLNELSKQEALRIAQQTVPTTQPEPFDECEDTPSKTQITTSLVRSLLHLRDHVRVGMHCRNEQMAIKHLEECLLWLGSDFPIITG
ncbi:MAG TPA: hypothetical protein DG761_09380 [Gammaproteobacteria bacterium]|nr:hypothetical protein [Gammaproteobacteria bacterium]